MVNMVLCCDRLERRVFEVMKFFLGFLTQCLCGPKGFFKKNSKFSCNVCFCVFLCFHPLGAMSPP